MIKISKTDIIFGVSLTYGFHEVVDFLKKMLNQEFYYYFIEQIMVAAHFEKENGSIEHANEFVELYRIFGSLVGAVYSSNDLSLPPPISVMRVEKKMEQQKIENSKFLKTRVIQKLKNLNENYGQFLQDRLSQLNKFSQYLICVVIESFMEQVEETQRWWEKISRELSS